MPPRMVSLTWESQVQRTPDMQNDLHIVECRTCVFLCFHIPRPGCASLIPVRKIITARVFTIFGTGMWNNLQGLHANDGRTPWAWRNPFGKKTRLSHMFVLTHSSSQHRFLKLLNITPNIHTTSKTPFKTWHNICKKINARFIYFDNRSSLPTPQDIRMRAWPVEKLDE